MRYFTKLNQEKVDNIKEMIKTTGLREASRKAQVSFYTVWCISKGKYDNNKPLQPANFYAKRCPITGMLIDPRRTKYADR